MAYNVDLFSFTSLVYCLFPKDNLIMSVIRISNDFYQTFLSPTTDNDI